VYQDQGLKGDEIPLEARIFALSDVYDALRSRRPYKRPFTHAEAAGLILAERGEHFDPDVVDAFIAIQNEFEAFSRE
jgi:putative two-component system response regulator